MANSFFRSTLAILLSEPGTGFEGGDFVLTEHARACSPRAEVGALTQGEGVLFAVSERPKQGTRGTYRVKMRHGVSRVGAANVIPRASSSTTQPSPRRGAALTC